MPDMYFCSLSHITITKGGELVSDNYGFIFTAQYDGDVPNGEWKNIDGPDVQSALAPGVKQIYDFKQMANGRFYPLTIDL